MRMPLHRLLSCLTVCKHFAIALAHAHPLDDLALVTLHLAGSERAARKPWPALDLDQLTRGDSPLELGLDLRQPRRAHAVFQRIAHQRPFIDHGLALRAALPR